MKAVEAMKMPRSGGATTTSADSPVCYLSGPMTGLPDSNQAAFAKGAALLRKAGWFVFNPIENDAEAGITLEGSDGTEDFDFKSAMARDLEQVCKSDAVFVLPGYEFSTGAEIECWVAHRIGVPVFTLLEGRPVEAPTIEPHAFSVVYAKKEEPHALPVDSATRKATPITTGVLDYFPAALAAVARVSFAGNEKHNPGQALHWARGKSTDQADAIARHLIERGGIDPETGQRYSAQLAWRALALLQLELEEAGEAPLARGARE